jgi:hypothetical protein
MNAVKPRYMEIEEAVTSHDPTIAMLQKKVMMQRFEKEDEPITYGSAYNRRRG